MATDFKDHFGSVAANYSRSRPTYPPALFDWLAGQCPARELAWDCGAGSGQASIELARHFEKVIATDASESQIRQAQPHPGIQYRVAPAEESGLAEASCDLVTVAQALHWFDLPRFYQEVKRVLKPGGVMAAWSYGTLEVAGDAVNAAVQDFYHGKVGPYWPAERHHVETGYRELPFPFEAIAAPLFAMSLEWRLPQLLDYFRSWSATGAYMKAKGEDPVLSVEATLLPLWGPPDTRRVVRWPLALLVGKP